MVDIKGIISNAFVELLKKHRFEEITVSDILDKSGVSRSTFYRYFKDKHDVMFYVYQCEVDEIIKQNNSSWLEGLADIFRFVNYRKSYFNSVIFLSGTNSFSDLLHEYSSVFYKQMFESFYHRNPNEMETYGIEYVCSGSVWIMERWAIQGYKQHPEDMAQVTFDLLPTFLKDIFKEYSRKFEN